MIRTHFNRISVFFSATAAAFALWLLCAPAFAAAPLTKTQLADVERIEEYLNSIRTMKARFLQVSSNGEYAEGDIRLSRPGKLRLDYAPPVPILILVTGSVVLYYDKELKQAQYIGTDQTPAAILVRDKIQLRGGDVTITDYERSADALRLTLTKTADPGAGSMTLVFSDKPLALRKWSVMDSQGLTTNVALMAAKFGAEIEPKAFEFTPPAPDQSHSN